MRALTKASIQGAFGRMPGGPHLYRALTRARMGTQASHIDKLSRAWPGYVKVWTQHGILLEGARIWMHDGGWTPFPFVLTYLLTGRAGIVTMWEGELEERYTSKAIEFGLKQKFGDFDVPTERYEKLRSLQRKSAVEIVSSLGGEWRKTDRIRPEMPVRSVDLLVTGGVLEHFRPPELDAFLDHSRAILRPAGWASHVFDLRDHLYHADKTIPYLNHLRFSDPVYALLFGHRLGYHNRLLAPELRTRIEAAGFKVHAMRRRALPMEAYIDSPAALSEALVGLDRSLLSKRFRDICEEDLRSVAVHFLCQSKVS